MTQRDRLLELLADFGITPDLDDGYAQPGTVVLKAKSGGVQGYSGFVCEFEFDAAGGFKSVWVCE